MLSGSYMCRREIQRKGHRKGSIRHGWNRRQEKGMQGTCTCYYVLIGNMYQMINCLRILIPHSLFGCVCVCILQVIYLLVATTNRAQHLYERQGYHVIEKKSLCCCGYWCMTGERVSTLCTRWSHGHTGSYHIDRILTFNYCSIQFIIQFLSVGVCSNGQSSGLAGTACTNQDGDS